MLSVSHSTQAADVASHSHIVVNPHNFCLLLNKILSLLRSTPSPFTGGLVKAEGTEHVGDIYLRVYDTLTY